MNSLCELDQLAETLSSEGMSIRLTIEAGIDGAAVDLQIIVSAPGETPEAGFGVATEGLSAEAAVQTLLHELDAGGLEEALAFRDAHRRRRAVAIFAARRTSKRQLGQEGHQQ